jgi:hypothetical protein
MASWLRLVAADPACGGGDARPVVAVADRLGVVSRIALSADAWDTRLQRVMTIDHRVVRLDRRLRVAHKVARRRLLAPGSDRDQPDTATVLADFSGDGGGPGRVPESTGRGPRDLRPDRSPAGPARRAEPEQLSRWETDGGRIRQLT